MEKRGILILLAVSLALFAMFFSIPISSADISFSNLTQTVYNYGDNFNLSAYVEESQDSNGFFTAKMACWSNELDLIKAPYTVSSGNQLTIPLNLKLDRVIIGNYIGQCVIKAE